jgi:hypothetical protein
VTGRWVFWQEACVSREGNEVLLVTASEQEDVMNDDDKFDAFRTVHDILIPKQPRVSHCHHLPNTHSSPLWCAVCHSQGHM